MLERADIDRAIKAWRRRDAEALALSLRLKPWAMNPLDIEGRCPFQVGSRPHAEWHRAAEMAEALEAAAKRYEG